MKRFILAVIVLYFGLSSSFIYSQNASDPYIVIAGSVNDENAKELGNMADIDGFLVGGASLDAGKFSTIYHAFD